MLQLRAEGLSGRAIAAAQGMSRKHITAVLDAADAAGARWDDVADLPEGEVHELLFPGRGNTRACSLSQTGNGSIARWRGRA